MRPFIPSNYPPDNRDRLSCLFCRPDSNFCARHPHARNAFGEVVRSKNLQSRIIAGSERFLRVQEQIFRNPFVPRADVTPAKLSGGICHCQTPPRPHPPNYFSHESLPTALLKAIKFAPAFLRGLHTEDELVPAHFHPAKQKEGVGKKRLNLFQRVYLFKHLQLFFLFRKSATQARTHTDKQDTNNFGIIL